MNKKIYIIAGEKSGDNLGAALIYKILEKSPNAIIKGIGGEDMIKAGLQKSLFNISNINLMGFFEIIPHIFKIIKLINLAVKDIIEFKPDVLVTIDSPGFNYRVVNKLKKNKFNTKFIHYVAPSVWAYKPKRAIRTAKLFDALISIIPWEKPLFEKHGLKTFFIGHSLFEKINFLNLNEINYIKNNYNIKNEEIIISVMAGSRINEIKNNSKILIPVIKYFSEKYKNIKFFILPTPENSDFIKKLFSELNNINYISDFLEKQKILQISDLAMVKSGTSSLEVSALKTPHFIFYKANKISAWLIKKMAITKFANLINISANKEIIKELLQNNFNENNVINISEKILFDESYKKNLLQQISIEVEKFKSPANISSSELAADIVLNI